MGIWARPSHSLTAALLGFASGALITAVAVELFDEAYDVAPGRAALSFACGALVFVVASNWLERHVSATAAGGGAVGFALLLGVTLDGIPENLAMGVSLIEGSAMAMLVAIFASNLPEALVGAGKMRESGLSARLTMAIWCATAVVLALAAIAGYATLQSASPETLAWPLGFAAGAVLASLANTLMPEAYREGGPAVAYATALGFLVSFAIANAA